MTDTRQFNPFTDRLSRDIRNELSSSLVKCLGAGDIRPAVQIAEGFLADNPGEPYVGYIEERLRRYRQAVEIIAGTINDPFQQGFVLWDLELFFEVHEVLEHAWYHAGGDTKLIMQALIRAAGVYIKLDCGYVPQARSLAAKSLEVLERHRDFLDRYFPADRLIVPLRAGDAVHPKLLDRV